MRLMFFWAMATKLPKVMVRTARTQRIQIQSAAIVGKTFINTRIKAANPAAFGPTDMKAVIAVGAPS